MTEQKHTPGPWHSVPSMPSEGFNCWWLMAGSRNIATISGYQGDTECEANARLIAAAPDMLEALRECCTDLMIAADNARDAAKTNPRWDGVDEKLMERVNQGRAAIAKAEGKE